MNPKLYFYKNDTFIANPTKADLEWKGNILTYKFEVESRMLANSSNKNSLIYF